MGRSGRCLYARWGPIPGKSRYWLAYGSGKTGCGFRGLSNGEYASVPPGYNVYYCDKTTGWTSPNPAPFATNPQPTVQLKPDTSCYKKWAASDKDYWATCQSRFEWLMGGC